MSLPSFHRTTQLVFPEAKTIYNQHDTGNKFLTPSGEPDECAYRTAPIVHPDPKPLYNFGDQGNRYLTPSGQPDERAYRTSPLVLADPKTGPNILEQSKKHITPSSGPINQSNLVRSKSFGWLALIHGTFFPAIQELKLRRCTSEDHQRDEDRPGLLVHRTAEHIRSCLKRTCQTATSYGDGLRKGIYRNTHSG